MLINKEEIETPALLVDLDVMEDNINKMAHYFFDKEAKLRPHSKTHKSPKIAKKQLAAGAIGICCQKLGEAEVMANAGIKNILITNQIIDQEKIERLVGLTNKSNIIVAVDNLSIAERTSIMALKMGVKQDVIVEVDVGLERCGVAPGKSTLDFVKKLLKFKGLSFRGLMGYEGPFMSIPNFEERKISANKRNKLLVDSAQMLRKADVDVELVSAGSTGTYNITGEYPRITEVEAGSYVFMDTSYSKLEGLDFSQALTLLTTVISVPVKGRAIINAGIKAITQEFGMPKVRSIEGTELVSLSEEHGKIKLRDKGRLKVGDKVELIPSHCCTTVNLHEKYYCIRKEKVEAIYDIPARGKFL